MYHIVVNPASRSGKGMKLWKEQLEPILVKNNIAYRAFFSSQDGGIEHLVASLTEEYEDSEPMRLIVIGGDGTLNEALNGMKDPSRVILGCIPTGSSNDFARDMNIPSDPIKALEIILHTGNPQAFDYGILSFPDGTSRRFVGSSGMGFDAATCEGVNRSPLKEKLNKIGLGKMIYLVIALKQLFGAKEGPARLYLDDKAPIIMNHFFLNACMIHRFEGGGFMFCPEANPADGLLDLCCVSDMPKFKILCALPTAFKGNHVRFREINVYRARTMRLELQQIPLWVHTDGEVLRECNEITVTCCHNGIYMIKP